MQTHSLPLFPLTLDVRQGEEKGNAHELYSCSFTVIGAEINNASVTVSALKGKEEQYSRSKNTIRRCVQLR